MAIAVVFMSMAVVFLVMAEGSWRWLWFIASSCSANVLTVAEVSEVMASHELTLSTVAEVSMLHD